MELGNIPFEVREMIVNRIEQNEDRAVSNLERMMYENDRRLGLYPLNYYRV